MTVLLFKHFSSTWPLACNDALTTFQPAHFPPSPQVPMPIFGTFPITYNLDSLYSPCSMLESCTGEILRAFREMLQYNFDSLLASGPRLQSCNLPSFQHARRPRFHARSSSFSRVSSAAHRAVSIPSPRLQTRPSQSCLHIDTSTPFSCCSAYSIR